MTTLFQKLLAPHHLEYIALNKELTIVETSSQVQRFAETPENVRTGQDIRLAFPELVGMEEILIDILEDRLPNFEFKAITRILRDGVRLYFDMYFIQLKEEEKQEQLILFLEDVTDRMALEQTLVQATNEMNLLLGTLEKTKAYIEKIIGSMAEALLVTTATGTIKTLNQAAQNLFGYTETELIGQSIEKVIADRDFLQSIDPLKPFPIADTTVMCYSKNGQKLIVSFSFSPIQSEIKNSLDGDSYLQDFVYIGRDITEYQRTQQRQLAQYATTSVLSESTTPNQAIAELLPVLTESLGWDVGEVWMLDREEDAQSRSPKSSAAIDAYFLRCIEIWVHPSLNIPEFVSATQHLTCKPHQGLAGYVWAMASSHWSFNVLEDPLFLRAKLAREAGLQSAFAFPILGDYEDKASMRSVLGAIVLFSRFSQSCDEDLKQTLTAIGSQIGQFMKRREAEAALRESEEQLRDLFENASDLIQSVGADGHFLYVNRSWRETLGYSDEELANLTLSDILYPKNKTQCMTLFQQVMSGKKVDQVQADFVTKDGRKITVEGSMNCKFIEGKPIATRSIFRDITERLRAEAALRKSEARLAEAQRIAHVGSYEFDAITGEAVWSEELFRIFGILPRSQEPHLSELSLLIHPDDRGLWQEVVRQAIEDGTSYEFDFRIVRPDGSIRYLNSRGKGVVGEEGRVVRIFGTAMDITERQQAAEALRQEQEKSESLLLNILPEPIADRLKQQQDTIAEDFAEVSVLFADIVGFTSLSASMHPISLVNLLNQIFSAFDRLCERYSLEKIKTIGDAYMVVGGLPHPRSDHAEAIAKIALDMQSEITQFNIKNNKNFSIRIGIHSGPVVAGVIGISKFIYDLWGDTVNLASRMESHGLAGRIQVSQETYELLKDKFIFEKRGLIQIKGKGEATTYFLLGSKLDTSSRGEASTVVDRPYPLEDRGLTP